MNTNNLINNDSDNDFYNLEKYFDNYNENISVNFYKRAEEFGFVNHELFKNAIFYIMYVKEINFYNEKKERYHQKKFSKKIFERDKKCIVIRKGNSVEFEASHIVPVSDGGDYTESNGILLTRNLHKLYDEYLWSINPETLCIDTISDDEEITGSIKNYLNNKVNLIPDFFMLINLKSHWDKFLDKKNKFINKKTILP